MRPDMNAAEIDWNAQLAQFTETLSAAGRNGTTMRVPRSFVLLSRVLGTLAGLLVRHKPNLQPFALIAPYVMATAAAA
jgi:hypothetical protein